MGCGPVVHEPVPSIELPYTDSIVVHAPSLLSAIDSTLLVSDSAIEKIIDDKHRNDRQLQTMRYEINREQRIIDSLNLNMQRLADSLQSVLQWSRYTRDSIENELNQADLERDMYKTQLLQLRQEFQLLQYEYDSVQMLYYTPDSVSMSRKGKRRR